MAQKSKNYTEDFKKQIVALRQNGKPAIEISKEYQVAKSSITKWVKEYTTTGLFKAKDSRTDEENELINLRKENKQLAMENDILKQGELLT